MSEIFTPQNGEDSNDDRPRLVLDTNTVLALWMFRDPKLEALRKWIEAGRCRLYSREDALEELRRVLAYRQFGLDEATQTALQADYRRRLAPWSPPPLGEMEERFSALPPCRDPDDQKFFDIAHTLGTTSLLTRDKALLRLTRDRLVRERIRILTPEHFQEAHLPDLGP